MNSLLTNKVVLIGGVVILFVVLIGGLMFWRNSQNTAKDQAGNMNVLPTEVPIPSISAEEIGLTLEAGKAKKTVIAKVENTEGITSLEYELSYISKGDIPRGAIGQLDLTKTPASKEITLGTCSDVCHYDEDVTDIKIIIKITKEDGSIFQSEAVLETL